MSERYTCPRCFHQVDSWNHICYNAKPPSIRSIPPGPATTLSNESASSGLTTGDNGAALALKLADEKLASVEQVLGRVTRAFDRDEDAGGSYRIEHDEMCPANALHARDPYCVCGMASTLKALIEACALMELAREQVKRLAEAKP